MDYEGIDELSAGKCRNFGQDGDDKSFEGFRIISADHELIAQLRKECFDIFSESAEQRRIFLPVVLISAFGDKYSDVVGSKKLRLKGMTQISADAENEAFGKIFAHIL